MSFLETLQNLSARDFADIYKSIFHADIKVFNDLVKGMEIAKKEITIESIGIK